MKKQAPEDLVNEMFAQPDDKLLSMQSINLSTTLWHNPLKHTAEARARLSASKMGKTVSEEARKKIGDANRGRKPSQDTISKMRQSHKARVDVSARMEGLKKAVAKAQQNRLAKRSEFVTCPSCGCEVHPDNLDKHKQTQTCKLRTDRKRRAIEKESLKATQPLPEYIVVGKRRYTVEGYASIKKSSNAATKPLIDREVRVSRPRPPVSEETRLKISAAHTGSKRSDQGRANMSAAHEKRVWPIKSCPHCGHTAKAYPNLFRWHFDNCIHKPN